MTDSVSVKPSRGPISREKKKNITSCRAHRCKKRIESPGSCSAIQRATLTPIYLLCSVLICLTREDMGATGKWLQYFTPQSKDLMMNKYSWIYDAKNLCRNRTHVRLRSRKAHIAQTHRISSTNNATQRNHEHGRELRTHTWYYHKLLELWK